MKIKIAITGLGRIGAQYPNIIDDELNINNFFSFLAAMMLAYQPVRSLSTLNVILNQGLSAASRILSVVDTETLIRNKKNAMDINIKKADIKFNDVVFSYNKSDGEVLKNSIQLR